MRTSSEIEGFTQSLRGAGIPNTASNRDPALASNHAAGGYPVISHPSDSVPHVEDDVQNPADCRPQPFCHPGLDGGRNESPYTFSDGDICMDIPLSGGPDACTPNLTPYNEISER